MTWVPRLNRKHLWSFEDIFSPQSEAENDGSSWWYFNVALYSLQPLAWVTLEKTVIMNQNNRNKPEMLWMKTFFCQTFWSELPRSWFCPHHPFFSPPTLDSVWLSWHILENPAKMLSPPRVCLTLQRSLGGSLMYSLWTPGFPLTDPSSYICLFH